MGRVLTSVEVGHPRTARRNASPAEVETRLQGRRVEAMGRHGKFLIAPLDDGYTLVAHLGMSGRFSIAEPSEDLPAHTHFVATLDDGRQIRFVDPRTFGFVAAFDEDELADTGLARLGPDAWEDLPDAPELRRSLRARRAPIKALLLDQTVIAGLGNIYVDEVLHRAGIHPLSPGGELTEERLEPLLAGVGVVLSVAIESGGTTLDDLGYLLPDGRAGENLGHLAVYGRQGDPCRECGTPIERMVVRA
ncbi:MAG TPA: bifunctional DNA-formamidopyrimidine glycosylase/DNA-(apurinic or apyrimidinic site) lyase, partial [Acidimicrobiia bacterium]|nr:bifunctional DNA-formamidopyrimidine glycosylase/DNA-(apurinic or apyrimidinic site) lyase [Acidimicrobiia bacterium]